MPELKTQIKADPWMDVMAAIYGRRAVRRYTAEVPDHLTIERLIDIAIQAPSAMNRQPWAFTVIEGSEILKSFSDRAKAYLPEPPEGNIFHDAPALVIVCATSPERQAAEDCCLAAQNFMLAAYAAGLATCPIGFSRFWLEQPATKREIGIPEDHVPVFPIALGFPDERPVSHGRREPEIVWY